MFYIAKLGVVCHTAMGTRTALQSGCLGSNPSLLNSLQTFPRASPRAPADLNFLIYRKCIHRGTFSSWRVVANTKWENVHEAFDPCLVWLPLQCHYHQLRISWGTSLFSYHPPTPTPRIPLSIWQTFILRLVQTQLPWGCLPWSGVWEAWGRRSAPLLPALRVLACDLISWAFSSFITRV